MYYIELVMSLLVLAWLSMVFVVVAADTVDIEDIAVVDAAVAVVVVVRLVFLSKNQPVGLLIKKFIKFQTLNFSQSDSNIT